MEPIAPHSSEPESNDYGTPSDKDGADDLGRLAKIAGETRGLVNDVKEWVDLRIQLLQVEVEGRIEQVANKLLASLAVIVFSAFALLFVLIAAALGIGEWIGHPAWGYLVIAGILFIAAMVLNRVRPRFVRAPKMLAETPVQPEMKTPSSPRLPQKPAPAALSSAKGNGDGNG